MNSFTPVRKNLLLLLFPVFTLLAGCSTLKPDRGQSSSELTLLPADQGTYYETQITPVPDIRITSWAGGARAACSLTFDDGTLDHYLAAFPILEEYGFKATFFLITRNRESGIWQDGSSLRQLLSWDHALEMKEAEHELGSHGYYHRDMRAERDEELYEEIFTQEFLDSGRIIEEKTGTRVVSYAWPYWRYSSRSKEQALIRYQAAREGSVSIDSIMNIPDSEFITPGDPAAVPSFAIMPGQTADEWQLLGDKVYRAGGWLTLCLHGIDTGSISSQALGWAPISESQFRTILNHLSKENIWTAPFGIVYQYIRQRNATEIEIISFTKTKLMVQISIPLESSAPLLPVTMEIETDPLWKGKILSPDGEIKILSRDNGIILAEFTPHYPPVQNALIVTEYIHSKDSGSGEWNHQ